ncbi:MAG: universal stress protein [Nitrospirae bacterium]|nr:universal stress protein [Nitrospirota bacterium]
MTKKHSPKINKKKVEELLSEIPQTEDIDSGMSNKSLNENRRVLLAVTDEGISSKTLSNTVTMCKRIGAELDVLYVKTMGEPKNSLDDFLFQLLEENVFYRLLAKTGQLKQEIINYTETNREILYVIVASSNKLKAPAKEFPGLLRNLSCPLVVI